MRADQVSRSVVAATDSSSAVWINVRQLVLQSDHFKGSSYDLKATPSEMATSDLRNSLIRLGWCFRWRRFLCSRAAATSAGLRWD